MMIFGQRYTDISRLFPSLFSSVCKEYRQFLRAKRRPAGAEDPRRCAAV